MAVNIMAFDFDIMYIKRNTISLVDAQSRQDFIHKKVENRKNAEDKMLRLEETDFLPLNRLRFETRQDPV